MSTHVVVKIKDENGASISPTAVKLRAGATEHQFAPIARQGLSLDLGAVAAGDLTLALALPDHPELSFAIKVTNSAPKAIRFAGDSPDCCTLTRQTASAGASGTRVLYVFAFKLTKKHTEVVLVAGWDYHGGADNTLYAKTWRDDLYAGTSWRTGARERIPKVIGDATRVTMFDFRSGQRIRFMKGIRNWHQLDAELQGSVPTYTAGGETDAALRKRHDDDSISIVHVYRYIQDLGVAAPGSLLRFDIFSHAWVGGPITINTHQDPEYDTGGTRERERDPGDKDGRTKDFSTYAMIRRSDFRQAFAGTAVAKMWGCQATTDNRALVRAAATAKDATTKLKVTYGGREYEVTAEQIKNAMTNSILPGTYMRALAQAAGIAMYGAPPGMGANLRTVGARNYMYVDQSTYAREYKWYKKALGLVPDETGYFAYPP